MTRPIRSAPSRRPPDANNVTSPIQVNNEGIDDRDLLTGALRLNFELGGGTLTSVSAYNTTEETITGDAYDFRPRDTSIFNVLLGTDLNQSQFLDLKSYSQEVRFTSNDEGRVRWIAGAYYVHTDRFISTGNMVDTGNGVFPVYRGAAVRRHQSERHVPRRLAGQRRVGGLRRCDLRAQ